MLNFVRWEHFNLRTFSSYDQFVAEICNGENSKTLRIFELFNKTQNASWKISYFGRPQTWWNVVSRIEMIFEEQLTLFVTTLAHVWLILRSRYNRTQYQERATRKSGVHVVETNRVRNRKCIWSTSHAAGLSPNKRHENTGFPGATTK